MSRLTKLLGIVAALLLAIPAQANETLTYDANGNVQSRALPGGTTQYGYDDLDRLTSEAGPAKTQSITYDPNDNRLSDGSGSKTYTANTNKLATANGQAVTLDKVGNITLLRDLSLGWNQAGQLKTVSRQSTVVSPQGGVTSSITLLASYFYDYRGRRSRKVTPTETTIYIYDLADHLLGEFNGTGSPLRTYIWKDDTPVAIILHGTPEKVLYLETDHLNTPIAARDENAKLVWKWESDAFGSTLPNEDPDGDGQKTTINLRFPGQFYDKESGFHYNHHRYYDPLSGRYISSDPIGLAGGRNSFGYVGGNPLTRTDPLGLFEMCHRDLLVPIPYARHCYMRFGDGSTSSYDPNGVAPDPDPNQEGTACTKPQKPEKDDCIKEKMKQCAGANYHPTKFNCCHCAEQAMKACGVSIPGRQWPNWPVNPGPQPGESGYSPNPTYNDGLGK